MSGNQATRTVNGPYNVLLRNGAKGVLNEFLNLPYTDVMGSQIVVSITDNFATVFPLIRTSQGWPTVEVSIEGSVAGCQRRLKIAEIRQVTGPLAFTIPVDEAYDSIKILARDITGGVQSQGSYPATLRAEMTMMVFVQPRGGFDLPPATNASGKRRF